MDQEKVLEKILDGSDCCEIVSADDNVIVKTAEKAPQKQPPTPRTKCINCGGKGLIEVSYLDGSYIAIFGSALPSLRTESCSKCNGTGYLKY